MMDKLTEVFGKLQASGLEQSKLVEAFTKIIHSPLIGLAIKWSPTPYDDAVLEILKGIFPAK